MICFNSEYEDVLGLRRLLEEIKSRGCVYNGTTRADLEEFFYEVNKNLQDVEYVDVIHSCELAIDYYLGKIIENEGDIEVQLEYYKKSEMYHNLMNELNKNEGDVSGLIQLIIGGRK